MQQERRFRIEVSMSPDTQERMNRPAGVEGWCQVEEGKVGRRSGPSGGPSADGGVGFPSREGFMGF